MAKGERSQMAEIRKVNLDEEVAKLLIDFSADWEGEGSCFGYRRNRIEDLQGRTIYLACSGSSVTGYLFGHPETAAQESCTIPKGSRCFEVEELFVTKEMRSGGIGRSLFEFMEHDQAGDCDYICLTTATRNARAILHFYLDEVGMTFWNARLFKKLDPDLPARGPEESQKQ